VSLRVGTLNVGSLTGRGREVADLMSRRKIQILCVQETRWKGKKKLTIECHVKRYGDV
jgi:Exonuclease III